jgi:hypothetical protein
MPMLKMWLLLVAVGLFGVTPADAQQDPLWMEKRSMSSAEAENLRADFDAAYLKMKSQNLPGEWPDLVNIHDWTLPFGSYLPRQVQSSVSSRSEYQTVSGNMTHAVWTKVYRDRIQVLEDLPAILSGKTARKEWHLPLNNVSKQYDFMIRLFTPCAIMYKELKAQYPSSDCRELGQLIVYKKGTTEILQVFNRMFTFWLDWSDQRQIPVLREDLTFAEKHIPRDVNFDGYEDLVLYDGFLRKDSHQQEWHFWNVSPAYRVYLFNPQQGKFEYSEDMTMMFSQFEGTLLAVAKRKRYVITEIGDGSCSGSNWSRETVWQVDDDTLVPVSMKESDIGLCADGKDDGKNYCYVTDFSLFGDGVWHEKEKQYVPCVMGTVVEDDGTEWEDCGIESP